MKHKHAELIKLWADGAEIEERHIQDNNEWSKWYSFDGTWWVDGNDYEYRNFKPEEKKPVVRWKWSWLDKDQHDYWTECLYFLTENEAYLHFSGHQYKKLDYTRTEFEE